MADETTKCCACGNPMLVRTAERYDGKCIPCAKGYRDSLEKAGLINEKLKRLFNEPDALFWRSLCERVENPALGFSSLPWPEKLYFAVCLLAGEISNGGFEQYFTNSSADYFDYAVLGLNKMGDELGLEITKRATRLLFDMNTVPGHQERLDYFDSSKILDDPEVSKILDALDEAFCENCDQVLSDRLTTFAIENGFW